jgi:hypothetical protein
MDGYDRCTFALLWVFWVIGFFGTLGIGYRASAFFPWSSSGCGTEGVFFCSVPHLFTLLWLLVVRGLSAPLHIA